MPLDHDDNVDPESRALLDAADAGDVASLRTLLERRPELALSARLKDVPWGDGENALMLAAYNGHAECVRLLLEAPDPEAQITEKRGCGFNPLMRAAEGGHAECMSLILDAAKNPAALIMEEDDFDLDQQTALSIAAEKGHAECVRLLLAAHDPAAQVMAIDGLGRTALSRAAGGGDAECVRLLLAAHDPAAQVMAAGENGQIALMSAAEEGHEECMRLLLAAHDPAAQVMAIDGLGWTALMKAACSGNAECVRLLLAAHDPAAQFMAADHDGWTALTIATRSHRVHLDCVRLLLGHDGHQLRSLTEALSRCASRYSQQQPPSPAWRDCIERLLLQGASLPVHNVESMLALEPILHDLLQQATTSDLIYEALLQERPGS